MMKVSSSLVCFLFLGTSLTSAQVPGFGQCPPNIQTMNNFDVSAFQGQWYEYERYPLIFQAGNKCTYTRYSPMQDGRIGLYNYQINKSRAVKELLGTAEINGPGKLKVQYPKLPSFIRGGSMLVLGTDYSSYAVLYSCSDFLKKINSKSVWILTRDPIPEKSIIAKAHALLVQNELSTRILIKTSQLNCPE